MPILQAGRLVAALPSLEAIRSHCRAAARRASRAAAGAGRKPDYPITYSEALEADARRLFQA